MSRKLLLMLKCPQQLPITCMSVYWLCPRLSYQLPLPCQGYSCCLFNAECVARYEQESLVHAELFVYPNHPETQFRGRATSNLFSVGLHQPVHGITYISLIGVSSKYKLVMQCQLKFSWGGSEVRRVASHELALSAVWLPWLPLEWNCCSFVPRLFGGVGKRASYLLFAHALN